MGICGARISIYIYQDVRASSRTAREIQDTILHAKGRGQGRRSEGEVHIRPHDRNRRTYWPTTLHRGRVPKHPNVRRRILYLGRRYQSTPVLLIRLDVEGSLRLIPVADGSIPHMGMRFPTYVAMYLALYFGWKPPPAPWG